MAQRTIHYLLGQLLLRECPVRDRKRFLLGSILPDAFADLSQRALTHYTNRSVPGYMYFDFDAYPYFGLKADKIVKDTVNDEFPRDTYYLYNEEGVPLFAFTYVWDMIHALYSEYGRLMWDYLKIAERHGFTILDASCPKEELCSKAMERIDDLLR